MRCRLHPEEPGEPSVGLHDCDHGGVRLKWVGSYCECWNLLCDRCLLEKDLSLSNITIMGIVDADGLRLCPDADTPVEALQRIVQSSLSGDLQPTQ